MPIANRLVLLSLTGIALILLTSCNKGTGVSKVGSYSPRFRSNIFYDLRLIGNNAYLTDNYGATILRLQDPVKPQLLCQVNIGAPSFAVTTLEELVYVGGEAGLTVADISSPAHPQIVEQRPDTGTIYDLSIAAPYLFIAADDDGLLIMDITDPTTPQQLAHYQSDGPCRGLDIVESTLYLSDISQGLQVMDISSPISPQVQSTLPDTQGAWGVEVENELLYVRLSGLGTNIYGITDPTSPVLLSKIVIDEEAIITAYEDLVDKTDITAPQIEREMFFSEQRLLGVSDKDLYIFNIGDPLQPEVIASYPMGSGCHKIACRGNYIYAVMKGLTILVLDQER